MNSIRFVWILLLLNLLLALLIWFVPKANAQVTNTYVPRGVAVFQPGQERECNLHWLDDLDVLREWQTEYHYWRSSYNTHAESLGFGSEFDTGNPTLNEYPVPKDIIQQELEAGLYPDFISACNSHVKSAHDTENDFAFSTWVIRLFTCHARATALGGFCDSSFDKEFPLEFIDRLK